MRPWCPNPDVVIILINNQCIAAGAIRSDNFDNCDNFDQVLLGVWKPIFPSTVCDFPLAVMDARTFDEVCILFIKIGSKFLHIKYTNFSPN